jgi:hypothetical protein
VTFNGNVLQCNRDVEGRNNQMYANERDMKRILLNLVNNSINKMHYDL